MIVRVEEMLRDVRVAIDMNQEERSLLVMEDEDTLLLDDIIRDKLTDAVRMVELSAPYHLLESGHTFGEQLYIEEDGRGFVVLPEDFLRLVSFRMSDWRRAVHQAIGETDSRYALQSSRWKGVCGTREKPVCAIVRRSEGLVLEFYSSRDNRAKIVEATYVSEPVIDRDGGIAVSRGCYRAAVYQAASLVLSATGDQLAGTMAELSKGLLTG